MSDDIQNPDGADDPEASDPKNAPDITDHFGGRAASLSERFDEPHTKREIVLVDDGEDCYIGGEDEVLTALLHEADELRAGMFHVARSMERDPDARQRNAELWREIGDAPPPTAYTSGAWVHETPLVLARGRGAWVVTVAQESDDVSATIERAVRDRTNLCVWLCEAYDWQPGAIPLGVTTVLTDVEASTALADVEAPSLPADQLIGKSDLWRAAEFLLERVPLGSAHRRGTPNEPEQAEKLFADLADLGNLTDVDFYDLPPLKVPRWMVVGPH